jgi:MFS family permease
MGLLTMGHSLGMLLGSFFAGIIMDYFGLKNAFPLGAIIMTAGILSFILLIRGQKLISRINVPK